MMRKLGFLCLFMMAVSVCAALPEGSVMFEAESLKPENNAWKVKSHFPNMYGGKPSGDQFLDGSSGAMGKAETVVSLPKDGKYRLWVRYLDIDRFRGATFKVTVLQKDKVIGEHEFDRESIRASAEGKKKWGTGFGQFVWDGMEFTGEAGNATVRISKGQPKAGTGSGSRHLDVFVITPDLGFEPRITDLYPLFVKVRALQEQDKPVAIHVFGRRSMEPWFTGHMNINRNGIFQGANKGAADMKNALLKPGEESPWVEISPYMSFSGRDSILFYAMENYHADPLPSSAFEIFFSKTPDDKGIFKKESRSGKGNGMIVNIDLHGNYAAFTDREGSGQSLKYARSTTDVKGRRPLEFPFVTTMALNPDLVMPEYVDNELEALKLIGISGLAKPTPQTVSKNFTWYMGSRFFFHLLKNGCPSQPEIAGIEEHMKSVAEPYKNGKTPWFMLNLMDEPGLEMKHITTCPVCIAGFAPYLEKQGVKLTGKPTADPNAGLLYYWSSRYRNHVMTEVLRTGTTAAHKFMPGIPTTVNFATEIVFDGNMIKRGCDWFEILGSGALTMGWHEDWANYSATYQVAGFQSDVMRAACRPKNLNYGIYNILARHPWDIEAKGFAEIGHGNKAMHFFSYGPYYSLSSDSNSHRPEIYQAIKNITMASGLVDKELASARVAPGDAAILFSVTGDIWNDGKDNPFGRERTYLSLLLAHCNYRLDILSEDDLSAELKKYKILFAVDSHLRRSQLAPLIQWVKDGGTLYLGAGALEFDEANQPLGLDDQLGLKREKLSATEKAGRPQYEMLKLKNLKVTENPPVLCGYQEPMKQDLKVGRGRVIFSGCFPGIGYLGTSTQAKEQEIYSVRDYSKAFRDYVAGLKLPVKPRLTTDNYRIEANLLEAGTADVIVLSNWTGKEQTVKVILNDAPAYKEIESSGELIRRENQDKRLAVTVRIGAGGYIKCKK